MKSLRCGANSPGHSACAALGRSGGRCAGKPRIKARAPPSYSRQTVPSVTNRHRGSPNRAGILGLESFLREHYTASRESAKSIANYLKSMEEWSFAAPARVGKRGAKGDEKAKAGEKKKPDAKPGGKDAGKNPRIRELGRQSLPIPNQPNSKPSDILAPEPKAVDSKAQAPAAGDPKPAESDKPEKADKPN